MMAWTVSIAAALLAFPALASIEILEPAEGALVPLHTDVQKAYVALPAAERRARFADAKFRRHLSRGGERLPGEKKPRESFWPRTVRLAWKGDVGVAYKVEVRDVRKGTVVADGTAEGSGELRIDNLEIAAKYEWTVSGGGETAKGTFSTEDVAPRLVRFPGVPNVRDLGGRIGLGGRRVRQGLVFRSAGLNSNSIKGENGRQPGVSRVEGANGEYIRARFGIKSDIDLRTGRECYGMSGSPLGPTVKWFNYPSSSYGKMTNETARAAFANVFRVFLDEKNYPIDFHCIAGQDRTGSVAYILNGLLGVDENQLALDWEATGFRNGNANFCHEKRYDKLVEVFEKAYPGLPIRQRLEKYILSLGFTMADIEKFRRIMLEGYAGN